MTPPLSAQTAVEGRYLLDAPLDGWGLGEVWQSRDKHFRGRAVLLKFLPADRAEGLAEVAHELRAQRSLKHPSVLPVINQGSSAGRAWVAYDGFEGTPLARVLDAQRRAAGLLDAATARDVFDKVLAALAVAHEAAVPVLHGCLQPASVLVKGGAVKVLDFGLHAFAPPAWLAPFAAPELAAAGAAPTLASEVFALGATLAEMLLPSPPGGDPRRALEAFLAALARDGATAGRLQRGDVSLGLWDAIARATRRDPAARWDDARAFAAALTAAWDAAPIAPPRAAPVAPAAPAPLAAPAFSAPAPLPPAPPLPRPPTMAMAPVPPAAFLRPPSAAPSSAPPVSGDAWATGQMPRPAALASAWDPPEPVAEPPSPAWSPPPPASPKQTLVAGTHPAGDDAWEESIRAAEPSTRSRALQESTMALDLEALAPAMARAPNPVRTTLRADDWKDAAVVLDTASRRVDPVAHGVSDDDDAAPDEPGARTHAMPAPAELFDTHETLQTARSGVLARGAASPVRAPPSDPLLGLDAETLADPVFATVPVPRSFTPGAGPLPPPGAPSSGPLPPHLAPAAPPRGFHQLAPAPTPPRVPVLAVVAAAALVLIIAALALALLR